MHVLYAIFKLHWLSQRFQIFFYEKALLLYVDLVLNQVTEIFIFFNKTLIDRRLY